MRTELFTVSRIFTEALYRIPDYQRGYSWGIDQLRDFWLDLEQLQGDAKHYTGVLTLEEVDQEVWAAWDEDLWIIKTRRYKPYYVVDGQQRLTTVIILIQAILDLERPSHLNFTPRADVRRKYIFDSKPEDSARSYIFGYEKDNPSYEFLKKRIYLEESSVHLSDEVTIYTKNLLAAKDFFKNQVAALSDDDVAQLFTKVTQQLVFNVYEIASDIDVFVTFETMNNRGKPLSSLELLKNRLIFLSSKLPAPETRERVLRKNVNEAWKSAYHYLGKNDNRPLNDDEFLRTHLAIFYLTSLEKYPEKDDDLQEEVRRRFDFIMENFGRFLLNDLFTPKRIGKDVANGLGFKPPALTREFIFNFSQQLKSCVELYFKLSTPGESAYPDAEKVWLERLGRLRGYSPTPMLLGLYRQENKSEKRVKFLELSERYQFLNSVGMRAHNFFYSRRQVGPDYFLQYVSGHLTTESTITLFENMISELLKEMPLNEQLHDWVKGSGGYYGWRAIRYFLYEYEISLYEKSRSGREKLSWEEFSRENYQKDYETIEHIYPQRARDKYWTDRFSKFNSTQKRLLRNSLGNLLALAKPRNSSLSNRPFPEKIGDEVRKMGYRYGSYSEIEVAKLSNWGPEEIVERGVKLLSFLEQRWKLSIGDRQQKIRALGLDFMKNY